MVWYSRLLILSEEVSFIVLRANRKWCQVHHLKISRACPYCGMEQTSRGGLRQHISRKHREEHKEAKEQAKLQQALGGDKHVVFGDSSKHVIF